MLFISKQFIRIYNKIQVLNHLIEFSFKLEKN
jgi:hypothetical protein